MLQKYLRIFTNLLVFVVTVLLVLVVVLSLCLAAIKNASLLLLRFLWSAIPAHPAFLRF